MNQTPYDVDEIAALAPTDDVPAAGGDTAVSDRDVVSTDPRVPVAVVSATVIVAGFIARAGVRTISGARTRRILRAARHRIGR